MRSFVVAVLAPLAVCGLIVPFRTEVANTNAALVLVLVVVGVAATGRRLAGVVAALSSFLWSDLLLAPPYGVLTITDPDDLETAILLTIVGIAVTEIALWGRRQQSRASEREGYLNGVVAAARIVASGEAEIPDLTDRVGRQITEILDLDACHFAPGPAADGAQLHRDGTITWNGHAVDVGRDGLPTLAEIELPVESNGVGFGHYVLVSATAVRRPTLEQRLVAVTLAEQVGAAHSARQLHG